MRVDHRLDVGCAIPQQQSRRGEGEIERVARCRGLDARHDHLARLGCDLAKGVRKKVPDGESTLVPLGGHHFAIGAQDREHVRNGRSSLFANTEVDDDVGVDHCIDIAYVRRGVPEEAIGLAWMGPPSHDPRSKETTALAIGQQEGAVVREASSGGRKCC